MQSEIKQNLEKIRNIWNNFIWEYKFCRQKIKFTDEEATNYFGDILGYFDDTLNVVFCLKSPSNYTEEFSNHISLLQAIYIQQDLIDELLRTFQCGITKEDLQKDENYSINRDIRNELIGHPISRKRNGTLISSTVFAYTKDKNQLSYLRYHKDNSFKFEEKVFKIEDMQQRHKDFLSSKKLNHIFQLFLIPKTLMIGSTIECNFLQRCKKIFFRGFKI